MIVITGPGRSGTSLLAGIYGELGFSPGGTWDEENRGGWENPDVTDRNQTLLRDLGITAYGPPESYKTLSEVVGDRLSGLIKNRLSVGQRRQVREGVDRMPFRKAGELSLMPFDRVDDVIARRGQSLREFAAANAVSKDPLFSWTLPIWLGAGADISHVIISTRKLDDAVASHDTSSHWKFRNPDDAKNSLLYSLGVSVWACVQQDVPFTLLRYPDFLQDTPKLWESLVFPSEVPYDDFEAAFTRVYRPTLVEAYKRDQPSRRS